MKPAATLSLTCLLATLTAFPSLAVSEVLKLDGGPVEVLKPVDAPTRGMTKLQVEKRYGKPLKKHPAVGKPPISSWDYPGYTVYFENQFVLHSVAHQK
jgi:hypothetical protein